jgi:hypothetical protein
MEALRQSEADARTFARTAALQTATVQELPAQARRTASPAAGNAGQQVAP